MTHITWGISGIIISLKGIYPDIFHSNSHILTENLQACVDGVYACLVQTHKKDFVGVKWKGN